MPDRIKGGRKRIGGLTLSRPERKRVDLAVRVLQQTTETWESRAEFIRKAALARADQITSEHSAADEQQQMAANDR